MASRILTLTKTFFFEWDEGNCSKSEEKHGVSSHEIETDFNDNHLLALGEQYQPEAVEARYGMIGKSVTDEILFICFTLREGKIRPISSRLANKKERSTYGKEIR